VVIGVMREEAREVMIQTALRHQAPMIDAALIPNELVPDGALKGHYQIENRSTAFMALRTLAALGWRVSEDHIAQGFQQVVELTGLLGRWQKLNDTPLTIADVAHNEDGIRTVLAQIQQTPHKQLHFVLGLVGDKDVTRVLKLLPPTAMYYFCKADIPRGLDAEMLKEQALEFQLTGEPYGSVKKAYSAAAEAAKEELQLQADGASYKIEKESKARAEAIKREAEALSSNPSLIKLRMIEKWNGGLPTYTGESIPLLKMID
jgi:dihydrofolate synthase/folylpolyglutamate synthase